ncbi:AAA family ATPase [Rhodospirillaceae bacterium SYSU D60014]|uniref:AAA family ATPase n=1 Tax=Virgifigura deserti TaxID=2268457 RepID=UPI000E660633
MGDKCKLEWALSLADAGFWVFPLRFSRRSEKWIPWEKGWQQKSTRDADIIHAWWSAAPDRNIGIFTGRFGDGRALCAIDIDVKAGKAGEQSIAELGELPETWESRTPSSGRHLVFVVDEPVASSVEDLAPGLDIRSDGAFIVAPGSVRSDGAYRLVRGIPPVTLPDKIKQHLGRPRERSATQQAIEILDDRGAVDRAVHFLRIDAPAALQGQHGDMTTVNVANRVGDFGISEPMCLDLMLKQYNPRCEPPWDPDELAQKVANSYQYRKEPIGCDHPVAQFGPIEQPTPAKSKPHCIPFTWFADVKFRQKSDYLVKGLLTAGGLSEIHGPPACGKSFCAFDLSMHVAMSRPWRDRKVKGGAVVYVAAEGQQGFVRRIEAFRRRHLPEGATGVPFALVPTALNLLDPKADTQPLIDTIKAQRPSGVELRLVVIDTLSRVLAGGDENGPEDMTAFIRNCDRIRETLGVHVCIVHHTGKEPGKGPRGHSSLLGAADTVVEVARTEAGRSATVVKQKDGHEGDAFAFDLDVVQLGLDEDGDEITSCVVRHLGNAPAASMRRLPKGQKLQAYRLLIRAIDEKGETPQKNDPIPGQNRFVRTEVWREFCEAEFIADSSNPDNKRRAIQRAMQGLQSEGFIKVWEDRAWIPDKAGQARTNTFCPPVQPRTDTDTPL